MTTKKILNADNIPSLTSPKPIDSVAEYVSRVMKLKKNGTRPTAFRGQAYHKWEVEPKIHRKNIEIYDDEDKAIKDVISLESAEFQNDRTMFDKLVRMQHFGLPTRLLDVTTNPLIALWFASDIYNSDGEQDGKVLGMYVPPDRAKYYDSDTVSCLSNLASLRSDQKAEILRLAEGKIDKKLFNEKEVVSYLCYYIGMEKPHFKTEVVPEDLLYPLYVKPKLNNKRIIAQAGAFLLYGAKNYDPRGRSSPIKADQLIIPAASKSLIREELEVLGINERTLFPDIERATKFVTMRYQNELRRKQESLL
ncbi:TPA: FRG domain-containing protein [Enterobacter asburiae]|uniref:FRG domain-containing protein n=1 Tax=Enterobacter asburiae TaxID=61645 RepID=UPI003860FF09